MNDEEFEFGNYGRIARRSWWVLAIGAVVGVLLAVFFLPEQSTFYESRVSVLLVPGDSDVGQGSDEINEDTEIGIAVSQLVGDRVVSQVEGLELDEWNENLIVSACIVNDDDCSTRILQFSYEAPTAEEAQSVVLLTAETYLTFRQDREQALRSTQVENLEAEFDDLSVRGETERAAFLAAEEDSLEAGLIERRLREIEDTSFAVVSQLTELRSRSSDVGSLLGDPSAPEAGSSGIPLPFAIVAGVLIGLMLGAVVAIGLDRLDRRVAGAEELEQDLGVPVLGDIPRITQDSPALVTAVSAHTPGAEAFRRVAAAALASRNGVQVSSIAIVGANENEGRTTSTINLALAMAQTGREVLVLNADRRNIVMDRIFGLVGEPGLNDYLRSTADLDAAHYAIDHASQRLGIRILSSGTGSVAPLSSSALQMLIAAAKERNMIVVFDTPPALTHAGGLQIAAIADAVYVVAAVGRTRRSELAELRSQLDNVQAYLAGAIFNRTSRLSLLPAGHGDIATVAIPTGVPGNVKNGAPNAFDPSAPSYGRSSQNYAQPQSRPVQSNGAAAVGESNGAAVNPPAAAAQPNGAVVQSNGAMVQPNGAVVQPNGAVVQPNGAVAQPNGAVVQPLEPVELPATPTPLSPVSPEPSAAENFANMHGLFGSDMDGEPQ